VGATAVALAMGKAIKDTIRYALEVDKASKVTGLAVEQFQELAYAAEQEHTSLETINKTLPILSKYMAYAQQGMETYKREFDKMGITVTDAEGNLKSTYDVLLEMSNFMAGEGANDTEKLAIVMTLLGRRGAELMPMLKKGTEWFKTMAREAHNLGIVLDEELVVKMKAFDDNMTKMKKGIQGAKIAFTEGLFPALESIANMMAADVEQAGGMRDMLKSLGEWIGTMSARLMDFVNNARVAISEMGAFLTNNLIKIVEDFEKLPWIGEKASEWKATLEALNTGFREQSTELQVLHGYYDRYIESLGKIEEKTEDIKEATEDTIKEAFVFSKVSLGPYLYELDAVEGKTIDIKDTTGLLTNKLYDVQSAIASAFQKGANVGEIFLNLLLNIVATLIIATAKANLLGKATGAISAGAGGGGGGGFWGTVANIAGAVLPFVLQKGGYVPGQLIPQVSSGRVTQPSFLVGEGREGETIVPDSRWKDMITVNVHNANPHTYVETLINLPQSEKQRLYRRVTKEASDREGRR